MPRIEPKAAVGIAKSRAIAKRLKFTQEGILRQAEPVNHWFPDLVLNPMLQKERVD